MNSARITYTPRRDATPETEVTALANVFRYVLDCHARKEAAPESRPNGTMKGSKNDRARSIIQESR